MCDFRYIGSELDLFAAARKWKAYWADQVKPFFAGDVLEVGAGIGSNTPFLDTKGTGRWVCLEPDAQQATTLARNLHAIAGSRGYETICGTIESLAGQGFDTIIYVDVLEHVERDRAELDVAASLLRRGGHLIVLAPAHRWLFTSFDAAIGHYRRYNRSMLRDISPSGLQIKRVRYLDSVGLTASAANLLILRQAMPRQSQLRLWDRWIVPVSRVLDKLLLYSIGKSILVVWHRPWAPSESLERNSAVGGRARLKSPQE